MIPRYCVAEMAFIWSEEQKWQYFLDAELAMMQVREESNLSSSPSLIHLPKGTVDRIRKKVVIKPERIAEIEAITKHDVIAFCSSITEQLENDEARYFHFGVTSSDIIDTAFMLQIKKSLDMIQQDLWNVILSLRDLAKQTKDWMSMGRSHGMYAEPMSFGQKWLGFYSEFYRRYLDYQGCLKEGFGQFSGAVGNYTLVNLNEEEKALALLGLKAEYVSTQVIPRDRCAKIIAVGGLLAAAIERLAVEIRHLHRSEVGELYEGFEPGQKGSSIMPHKKNPIAAENLCGVARMLRSHVGIAMENCILWHERDISHSSAERLMFPDHFGLLSYALRRCLKMLKSCVFQKEIIEKRAMDYQECLSSYVLHMVLQRVPHVTREEVYAWIQSFVFQKSSLEHHTMIEDIKDACEKKYGAKYFQGIVFPSEKKDLKNDLKNIYLREVEGVFQRVWLAYPS
jgi:adenylosuccinate lyase